MAGEQKLTVDDLEKMIIDSTQEIFTNMVMMEAVPGRTVIGKYNPLKETISGVVGLAERYIGVLAVHFPYGVAREITGNFLGITIDSINEDVADAIGEIANMLAGSIKSCLSRGGKDIALSLPSTVNGKEYSFLVMEGVKNPVIVEFQVQGEIFLVELQLRRNRQYGLVI